MALLQPNMDTIIRISTVIKSYYIEEGNMTKLSPKFLLNSELIKLTFSCYEIENIIHRILNWVIDIHIPCVVQS